MEHDLSVNETLITKETNDAFTRPKKTALLLVNQKAGMGSAKEKVFSLITELTKLHHEVITFPIMPGEGFTSENILREYQKKKLSLVACIGGDGTLNHVVNALLPGETDTKSKTPIVYVPSGTTNDYAKTLGLNGDVEKVIDSVREGRVFRLDVGQFGNLKFNYVAAFGAFTNVSYETPQDQKNVLGYFAYVMNAITAAPSSLQSRYRLAVSHDGETEEGTFIFGAVSNATSVAGFKTQALSDASLSDGLFEVLLIKAPDDLMDVGEIIRSAMDGNFDNPYIRMFQTQEVNFHSEEAINWTLDGEFGGSVSDVNIKVLPKAIKIYTEI